jgi:hypothetical protein
MSSAEQDKVTGSDQDLYLELAFLVVHKVTLVGWWESTSLQAQMQTAMKMA